MPKDDLQHYWMLYSMQGEGKHFDKCITIFLDNYRKCLLDCDNEALIVNVTGSESVGVDDGPHLFNLPDGFLSAVSRSFRRHVDIVANKVDLSEADVLHVANLTKVLIVLARNVDNLSQLASSSSVNDCVAIAGSVLRKDFVSQHGKLQRWTDHLIRLTFQLLRLLYDPSSLWAHTLRRTESTDGFAASSPPPVQSCVMSLISKCIAQGEESHQPWLTILALHALGSLLAGSKTNGVAVTSEGLIHHLFQLLTPSSTEDFFDEETVDLALQCITLMVYTLLEASPDERSLDVSTLFSAFLQTLRSLPSSRDNTKQIKLKMLECIQDMSHYIDRSTLQAIFIGVGIFEQLVQIIQQAADVVASKDGMRLAVSSIKVLASMLRNSTHSKNLFVERIGYRMFFDVLTTITDANSEFIEALLELVVESSEKRVDVLVVSNPAAAVMLLNYAAVLKSADLQLLIVRRIHGLVAKKMHSRIQCSAYGMLEAVLTVLGTSPNIRQDVADQLIKLFETIASHSIDPIELRMLLRLLAEPVDNASSSSYKARLIQSISIIAESANNKNPVRYFDIQGDNDGIVVAASRNKWPGPGFSFHAWVCLDDRPLMTTISAENAFVRRILYSVLNSQGFGFEAFFTYECVLVVAVSNKKEYIALSLTDHGLHDCKWHCITIVHAPARRPFGSSTLSLYLDGRLVHATAMKLPPFSDPFTFLRIGSAPVKAVKLSGITAQRDSSYPDALPVAPMSPKLPAHELITVQQGSQDHIFGVPVSLKGQLNSVCIFSDAVLPSEAKELFDGGPNIVFRPESVAGDLASRLFLYYHSNGCQGNQCADLSPSREHDGTFSGNLSTAWNMSASLACVGGFACLLPLLDQANTSLPRSQAGNDRQSNNSSIEMLEKDADSSAVDSGVSDWVVVQSTTPSRQSDRSSVAAFIHLLRKLITHSLEMQEDVTQSSVLAVIGLLLSRIESQLLDVDVLFALEALVEAAQGSQVWISLLTDVYQNLLFNFRIWVKAEFTVRLGHLQYVRKLIKDDKKSFRKKFGVQLFLDTLRIYSTKTSAAAATLTEDEGDILRKHTIGVIQEFICQNITHYEIAALISFLLASSCEKTVEDLLTMLLTVLESPNKSDQIYLLFFEPHAADSLYYLLLKSRLSSDIKDKVVQLLSHLLKSGKVYDKSKTRLRLLDVGIGGMLLMMPGDLPLEFTKVYLEQYLSNSLDHPSKFACVLALFNKLQNAPVMVKLDFARKLLYALYMKQGATAQIAAQPGWYHSLTNLFVEVPMAVTPETDKTRGSSVSDLIDLQSPEEDSVSFNEAVRDRMAGGDYLASQSVEDDTKSETGSYISRDAADQPDFVDTRKERQRMLSSSNVSRNSLGINEPDSPSFRRNGAAEELVLATGNFTFLDDALTNTSSKPETAQDDLCNVTLNILSTVLWQGIDGSSVMAWGKRAEVIVSLDMIALGNYLYRRPEELKRRLYEAAVQVVTSDVRKDPTKSSNIENAELVIRFVHDFITAPDLHVNIGTKLSEKLLEDLSTLFDTIRVWEADTSSGWSETLQMAMDIWLTVTRCPEMNYCSIVIPKLHYLIQHRLSCSRREVCYILSALNEALFMAIDMSNHEHISFIVPVLRLILEKWGTTLSSARYLPNIPALSVSPQTWPIIQKYFRSPEWGNFVGNHVTPLSRDYVHAVCKIRKERMGEFWNEAQDAAMSQLHKRNKAFGESKLRFTQDYIEPVKRKIQDENYRFGGAQQEIKAEIARTTRKWEELRRYLFRERGPWFAGGKLETMSLRMSPHENFFRMRPKLSENFHFDLHTAAAQLRDYTAPQYHPEDSQLVHIVVAKEAKVDHVVEDFTFDEEVEPVPATRAPSAETQELEQKEKMVMQELCDLVTITELVQGRFELTTQRIKFHAINPTFDANTGESYDIEVPLSSLREIHPRRYNLRRSAMEFFLVDQTNFLINFKIKTRNEIYRKVIGLKPPSLTFFKSTNPSSLLRASNLTQRWVQREISNFEYLMALNTIAGRTYNDLSQYPVFPWVLRDYKSEELNLDDPGTFRDFTRPMGVQNPKSVNEVRNKFDNFEDPTGTIEPFHYGQHYSNPASVIHYLLRVEPFTTMHIQLQSGRFDVADRQFHSIASTWELLWNNPNDVKELIPEFFYLPEFLVNLNGFDLGRLQQSRDRVNDVLLPNWASTPEEFIYRHRKALESDYVSAHLHEWIDLVFGYKQQGPEAVEALNVFYYCTYEGAVDLDAIKDPVERQATEGMINNFGQTPTQLLKEPHPRRLTFDEALRKYSAVEGRSLNVFHHTKYLKAFLVEANVEGDALVYVALPRAAMRAASAQGVKSDLITLGMSGSVGIHSWTPFDRSSAKNMTFERDPAMLNARFARSIAGPFHPSLNVTSNLFAITADCRLLFFCGNWDNSLRIFNFAKGKITAQVIRHRDLITCVALDNIGLTLISGSRDTTCLIWEVTQQAGVPLGINGKPLQTLYGHTSEVTSVAISVELDMAVSGAADGTLIVHTVKNGSYVRTLCPNRTIPCSPRNRVNKVVVMYDGKICAASYFPECRLGKHSIDLYSVNGKHLYTAPMMGFVNELTTSEDFVISGDADGRLEIREWFELKQVYSMQVSGSIASLAVTRQNSHILAGLQDGKLIIVTVAPNIMDVVDR